MFFIVSFIYYYIIFVINNLLSKSNVVYGIIFFFMLLLVSKSNSFDFIDLNSNIYNLFSHKISLLWSISGQSIYIILFLFCFIYYFWYKSNKKVTTLRNINISIYCLLILLTLMLYNFLEFNNEFSQVLNNYNIILDHSLVSLHPPLILLGIIIIRVKVNYFLYFHEINNKVISQFISTKSLYLLYIILTIGILSGSIWSTNLFGWGGWWIWDPIENISFFYWLILLLLFHVDISYSLLLLVCMFIVLFDLFFFCTFKLSILSSLHVFQNNLFFLNASYFPYIILISTVAVILVYFLLYFNNTHSFVLIQYYFIIYVLYIILALLVINFVNKLFNLNLVTNDFVNLFYFFCYYILLVELTKYIRLNILLLFVVCTVFFIITNSFFIIFLICFLYMINGNNRLHYYLLNHFIFLITSSILIFFLITEKKYINNYLDIMSAQSHSIRLQISNIITELNHISFSLNTHSAYFRNNYSIFENNTINCNLPYFSFVSNMIQDKNELFMVNSTNINFLLKFDFSLLKMNSISYMFIVMIGLFFFIIFFIYYQHLLKFNQIVTRNTLYVF